jgi:hypothetical protein
LVYSYLIFFPYLSFFQFESLFFSLFSHGPLHGTERRFSWVSTPDKYWSSFRLSSCLSLSLSVSPALFSYLFSGFSILNHPDASSNPL